MLHLVPDAATDFDALDPQAAFAVLYDSLYDTPPAFVTQLMALTPCAEDDPRSLAHRPLPVFRAPLTHPLCDREQAEALLLDHERYEDAITATIRVTGAADTRPAPTPIHTHWRREYIPLQPVSGDDHCFVGG